MGIIINIIITIVLFYIAFKYIKYITAKMENERNQLKVISAVKAIPIQNKKTEDSKMGNAKYYCNACHNSPPVAIMKGNGWIEFVLYLCYLAPGIIYSVWRRSGEPNTCPVCKAAALVPLSAAKPFATLSPEEVREERECPHCAEKILVKAKLCKHCGQTVQAYP